MTKNLICIAIIQATVYVCTCIKCSFNMSECISPLYIYIIVVGKAGTTTFITIVTRNSLPAHNNNFTKALNHLRTVIAILHPAVVVEMRNSFHLHYFVTILHIKYSVYTVITKKKRRALCSVCIIETRKSEFRMF